jgi:hypothetical protein
MGEYNYLFGSYNSSKIGRFYLPRAIIKVIIARELKLVSKKAIFALYRQNHLCTGGETHFPRDHYPFLSLAREIGPLLKRNAAIA